MNTNLYFTAQHTINNKVDGIKQWLSENFQKTKNRDSFDFGVDKFIEVRSKTYIVITNLKINIAWFAICDIEEIKHLVDDKMIVIDKTFAIKYN